MPAPFRYRFRVRYQDCDGQKIVFNARWGDYVDIAATELVRAALGHPEAADWRLVRQVLEWKRSGRFDDLLEARVTTKRIGTTSVTLATEFVRLESEVPLVTAETVYVMTDPATGRKRPVTEEERRRLADGATPILVDCSGANARPPGEPS
ncbi:MAG: thioesterase family protein [Kofleriaceae bacterium]